MSILERLPIAPTCCHVVDRIPIIRVHRIIANCQRPSLAILGLAQRCALPQRHILPPRRRRRRHKLLRHDKFCGGFAKGVMLADPGESLRVVVAPEVGVQVAGVVFEGGDGEVFDEITLS